jgi:osmotically-inducible protein OsmY
MIPHCDSFFLVIRSYLFIEGGVMQGRDQFDDQQKNQSDRSDIDYEETHSTPTPGGSEYIPEAMEGIGPVGYRRSDEDVIHEVYQKLAQLPDVNASRINAKILDGIVTLRGGVMDEDQKRKVADMVRQVPGVAKVNNELETDII